MNIFKPFLNWLGGKFDSWLQKVGEENRPEEHDHDLLYDDDPLIRRSDFMPDERGDFDSRF
jgi:hypothetical protein